MASSFNKYFASWKDHIPKKMYDSIAKRSPTLAMLMKNKKEWDQGGDTIRPHIKYAHSTAVGSYQGYDTLDITPQSTRTDAEFRMKQLYASIIFNGYEEAASRGENAVFKMAEIAMKDAEDALTNALSTQIFGDGTGNSGKNLLGLAAAIDDGTNVATYAGINRTTYTWWKAQVNLSLGAVTTAKLRSLYTAAVRGGMKNAPDFAVAGLDAWNFIATLLDTQQRIVTETNNAGKMFANFGFPMINFMGIPIVYDEYCPADQMYLLNSETIQLWNKPGMNFKPTEMVKIPNMDAYAGQILFYGELICTEPRANGHADGIAAPA